MKTLIAEDEPLARDGLADWVRATPGLQLIDAVADGEKALRAIRELRPELVLMDIQMPGLTGLQVLRALQAEGAEMPRVIFTTAYDEHALAAFELHAVDYLLKPIRLRRLHDALARVRALTPLSLDVLRELHPEPRRHLSVQERGRVILVPVDKVLYMRAELKYVTIRSAEREYLLEESLTRLEQEFHERFVRIHRNCLVARDAIDRFERASTEDGVEGGWSVVLHGVDERLPVSRRQQHVIKEFGRL
jgi:two-component system response regulator AlgR